MRKYKLRNTRRKATFGIDGAIQAAAQLTATGLQIANDTALAKQQAAAMKESATMQADALKSQNENNNLLQQQSLELIKDEKKRDREMQQDMQMTMQMQAARQNQRALELNNAIQVKNGGSARRKLRNAGIHSSLRAGKIPGIVTPHQGDYVPVAYTSDSILSELVGQNHDKGGIDIDILGNKDIEAEGGELMLAKYGASGNLKDVQFISKHKLPGTNFNPKKAVMSGAMSPDEAFATQETIKNIKGISDDGKTTPVRRKRIAGGDYTTLNLPYELINLDNMPIRSLKCGGRVRHKFENGGDNPHPKGSLAWYEWEEANNNSNNGINTNTNTNAPKGTQEWTNNVTTPTTTTPITPITPTTTTVDSAINDGMTTSKANLISAGINLAGNVGSAILSKIGNNILRRYAIEGTKDAANILVEGINSKTGIDPASINKSDFKTATPLAAIQTPTATASVENALASRDYNRQLSRTRRSGINAAAINKHNYSLGVNYQDILSKNQSAINKLNQAINQSNMDRITEVSKLKAQVDSYNLRDWANANLALLQYNNNIKNEKIEDIAQIKADKMSTIAGIKGDIARQNWSNIGTALNAGANAFGSAFQTNARMQNNLDYAMLGASDDSVIRWIDANPNNPNARRYARGFWRRYRNGSGDYKSIADRYQQQFGF